jgi:hypothetical protein
MANRLFVSGNYIISVKDDVVVGEYPVSKSIYSKTQTGYIIKEQIDNGELSIATGDIPNWLDAETGGSSYTEETLVNFLRTNTANFRSASGGSGAIGAKVLKTNQTVSYRTGDDGDIQAGRKDDFYTLASNNPFGNLNRFTDEIGGQTFTNDIVLDWSTYDGSEVLGYYRSLFSSKVWNDHIDDCLVLSVGSFTSGWRMINRKEMENIHDTTIPSNTPNLYFPAIGTLSTSTTYVFATGQSWCMQNAGGWLGLSKLGTFNTFAVRDFTVNGTTIT